MAVEIQVRRDTAANWISANPVLAQGEWGLETDTSNMKIGNGASTWTQLPYQLAPASVASNAYVQAASVTAVAVSQSYAFTTVQAASVNAINVAASSAASIYAPTASPALTGVPTAPTMSLGVNSGYDQAITSLNPIGWWKLSDIAGSSVALDSSGNNFTGTASGSVSFGQTGPITGVPSETSALFNGSTSVIKTTGTIPLGPFSFIVWTQITSSGLGKVLIGSSGPSNNILLGPTNSNLMEFRVGSTGAVQMATTYPSDGNWHMWAGTYDGSSVGILYLDGQPVKTTSGLTSIAQSSITIGAEQNPSALFWPGYIAQVSIFNVALSPTQISNAYTAASVGVPIANTTFAIQAASVAAAIATENILQKYNISGLGTTWAGSASIGSQFITTTSSHDFSVGQGIQIWGAGASPSGIYTPTAPSVSAVGTNAASVSYVYGVAGIGNSVTINGITPVSATSTFMGNSSLSSANYNQIQWTPTFTPTANQYDGYAVYGRTSGSVVLIGTTWLATPNSFAATNSLHAPPYLGANLSPLTTYVYSITGVDWFGNESTRLLSASVTTGSSVLGTTLSWGFNGAQMIPYESYNVYRNNGFMQQVPIGDCVWQDAGTIVPGAAAPTVLTLNDIGQSAVFGPVGVNPNVPLTAASVAIGSSLITTVTAITNQTITIGSTVSSAVTNAVVIHDDTSTLQSALTALGFVHLPSGYYFLSGNGVTVPAGGALTGPAGPWAQVASVSTQNNGLPPSKMATLCFTSLNHPGVTLNGDGPGAQALQLFWPYQTNGHYSPVGTNDGLPYAVTPYAPGIITNSPVTYIRDIVDCNSWIAMFLQGGLNDVDHVQTSTICYCILSTTQEQSISNIRGDRATTYSSSSNMPIVSLATAIRGFGGSGLFMIDTVGCDHITEIWITSSGGVAGGGTFGSVINNVWNDDFGFKVQLDVPLSQPWVTSGAGLGANLSNLLGFGGEGNLVINSGSQSYLPGDYVSGTVSSSISIVNSGFSKPIELTGQMVVNISGCVIGQGITCNATSLVTATPAITINGSSIQWNSGEPRFNVTGGYLKAHIAACGCNGGMTFDSISNGASVYVIDDDALHTSRFHVPPGTILTPGSNVVGNILLPQPGSYPNDDGHSNYFYVVSATGNGSSITDQWTVNSASVFSTSASVGSGLYAGAVGEGYAYSIVSAYTFQNPAGTVGHFSVLPVAINVASGLTTTTAIEGEIVWCLTPLSA